MVMRRMAAAMGLAAGLCVGAARAQETSGATNYPSVPHPLLSIDSLGFLEGTWTAVDTAKREMPLPEYRFQRELAGHVMERVVGAPGCVGVACGRRDVFYIFQDSAGAPLQAIQMDDTGRVIRFNIELRHEGSTDNQRDLAVFLSDPAALGPRYRLSYERNIDTVTKKTSLRGRFEMLLANGKWVTQVEWAGIPAHL